MKKQELQELLDEAKTSKNLLALELKKFANKFSVDLITRIEEMYVSIDNISDHIESEIKEIEKYEEENKFVMHGAFLITNTMGYEIMLSDNKESAKLRWYLSNGTKNVTEWLDIEYVNDHNVIDPKGYNIPLDLVIPNTK